MDVTRAFSERIYRNAANPELERLIDSDAVSVLDIGCGAGETAARLRARDPHKRIYGVTASQAEADEAREHMSACWVADVECGLPAEAREREYDVVVLSHVLEHLREPARVVQDCARVLRRGGHCVIAVPNIVHWRQRWRFLLGNFEYADDGPLDVTHLRFFTYESAEPFLLARAPELQTVHKSASGSAPLWLLRRHVLSSSASAGIDVWFSERWPNLFGGQVLIKARRR